MTFSEDFIKDFVFDEDAEKMASVSKNDSDEDFADGYIFWMNRTVVSLAKQRANEKISDFWWKLSEFDDAKNKLEEVYEVNIQERDGYLDELAARAFVTFFFEEMNKAFDAVYQGLRYSEDTDKLLSRVQRDFFARFGVDAEEKFDELFLNFDFGEHVFCEIQDYGINEGINRKNDDIFGDWDCGFSCVREVIDITSGKISSWNFWEMDNLIFEKEEKEERAELEREMEECND